MSNFISELKLPAVILLVLLAVWQVAQWTYRQERQALDDGELPQGPKVLRVEKPARGHARAALKAQASEPVARVAGVEVQE